HHETQEQTMIGRAIHVTCGNHAGPRSERGLEQYDTPPCAIEALLAVEPLPKNIWEPCCGSGSIVRVLEAHGHRVSERSAGRRNRLPESAQGATWRQGDRHQSTLLAGRRFCPPRPPAGAQSRAPAARAVAGER